MKRAVFILAAVFLTVVFIQSRSKAPSGHPAAPRAESKELDRHAKAALVWPPGMTDEETARPTNLSVGELTAKNYYVILDASGSMDAHACSGNRSKWEVARDALHRFSKSAPVEANLGLMTFDGRGVRELVPLGRGNREAFRTAVDGITPGGDTPLRTAIELARKNIESQARAQLGYGDYTLVVVTDGEASTGEDPRKAVNGILAETRILINTLGFCVGEDHSLNQPRFTTYKNADSPEALTRGLEDVLAESETFDADFKAQ